MQGMAESRGRRIMVAVDESEESTYALKWCLERLVRDDTVILLYARPPPPVYSAFDSRGYMFSEQVITAMDRYSKRLADSVLEKAENMCKIYGNIEVRTMTHTGDAGDVICDMVEKVAADVLVMGSHGYGFVKRALLGSVSSHCVRNVKCPVLVVKRPH